MSSGTMTNLAAKITNFEHEANFVRIDFQNGTDLNKTAEDLQALGITDIVNKYTNGIVKSEIKPVFILKYQYSPQKRLIDNLEHKFVRMSALQKLWNYGGLSLDKDEQAYFDEITARAAAAKMAGKSK